MPSNRRRYPSLFRALMLREQGLISSSAFSNAAHYAIVPSHTFYGVTGAPDAVLKRFTPCGKYLVALDRNRRELLLFRFETGGPRLSHSVPFQSDTFDVWPLPQLQSRTLCARARLSAVPTHDWTTPGAATSVLAETRSWISMSLPHLYTSPEPVPTQNAVVDSTLHMNRSERHRLPLNIPLGSERFPQSGQNSAVPQQLLSQTPTHLSQERNGILSSLDIPFVPPNPRPGNAQVVPNYRNHSCSFARYFSLVHTVAVGAPTDLVVREFCLATQSHLILASFQEVSSDRETSARPPAICSLPCIERITFHLIHTETGQERDRYILSDDYVALDGHKGVHMYKDMLCILSLRHQTLHVLQIQETTGRFVCIARIGNHCNLDDEIYIARARDAQLRHVKLREFGECTGTEITDTRASHFAAHAGEKVSRRGRTQNADDPRMTLQTSEGGNRTTALHIDVERDFNFDDDGRSDSPNQDVSHASVRETGLGGGKSSSSFVTGLMQRLLVYVFQQHQLEQNMRYFFRVVGQYSMLVMLKAQLLDENHLLIKLGSSERSTSSADSVPETAFFAVYCISSTRIIYLFENNSQELCNVYETYREYFVGDRMVSAMLAPWRPTTRSLVVTPLPAVHNQVEDSANVLGQPTGKSAHMGQEPLHPRRIRSILSTLPISSQARNVSVYLDRKLFSYPEDRVSALDGTRAISMRSPQSIKFLGVGGGGLRFKLMPGIPDDDSPGEASNSARPSRRKALFLFHPFLPFVISLHIVSPMLDVMNFHVWEDARHAVQQQRRSNC